MKKKDCFECSCNSTIRTDDQGLQRKGYTSPVKWVGESCELQDLSVEFGIQVLLLTVFSSLDYFVGPSGWTFVDVSIGTTESNVHC